MNDNAMQQFEGTQQPDMPSSQSLPPSPRSPQIPSGESQSQPQSDFNATVSAPAVDGQTHQTGSGAPSFTAPAVTSTAAPAATTAVTPAVTLSAATAEASTSASTAASVVTASATTAPASTAASSSPFTAGRSMARSRLSFFGSVRAELFKLFSIGSTWWLSGIAVVMAVGFSALLAWTMKVSLHYDDKGNWQAQTRPVPRAVVFTCISQSMGFAILFVGVVGVLAIAGEYATSSVQMSLVVNPHRVMFMNAKAAAVALYSFVLGFVMLLPSWGVVELLVAGSEQTPLTAKQRWLPLIVILGGAVMVALVTELALGLGAIVRSTAGGVVLFIAIYMMLPSVFDLISNLSRHAQWAAELSALTPSNSVTNFLSGATPGMYAEQLPKGWFVPNWWQSGLVMLAWAVVVYVAVTLVVRYRDVK